MFSPKKSGRSEIGVNGGKRGGGAYAEGVLNGQYKSSLQEGLFRSVS